MNLCFHCKTPAKEPCYWIVPHGISEVHPYHISCFEIMHDKEGGDPKVKESFRTAKKKESS